MNVIKLEELEKLTEKLYGPQADSNLLDYSNLLKQNYTTNFSNFQELFGFFIESNNQHCLFWLLDILTCLVNSQYKNFPEELKGKFRELIVFIIENHIHKVFIANFIETKFCVLLINWIKHDYPESWPNFYKDFISLIFNTTDESLRLHKVTLLVDLLLTFDDELIKFRHTYTDYEVVRSTVVKDYMRTSAVSECVYVLNQLMQNEKHFSKKLIKNSIKVISLLLDWNALNLFEESVKIITTSLIEQPDFENESLEVLNAIIEKGMELNQKLDLIKYLNINTIISNLLKDCQKLNENSLFHICEIVGNIGNFTIECFELVKSITKGEQTVTNVTNPEELFAYVTELTNYALYHTITVINYSFKIELKTALNLCDYIANLTTYLKNNEFIAETFNSLLKSLVQTIENFLIIPSGEYDIKSTLLLNKEDDDFFNFRKEYTVLYQNFFHIPSLKLFILDSINERLSNISAVLSSNSFNGQFIYEVELTLHLVYNLQNTVTANDTQNSTYSDYFNKLLFGLFNIPFANVDSDLVLILFYDTVYKYIQYIINNDGVLIYVTKMYLSKQGIMHPNPIVGARISVSFDKFVDKVRTQLGKLEIIYEISETLKNFLQYLCCENKNLMLVSEYNVLFKTLCVTILQKNFHEDKRETLFIEVFALFDAAIVNFGLDNEKFIEICKCIANFIKSVGFELNPSCKVIFMEYFNKFINNIYLKFPKHSKVDYSMLTIIQRLVTILGKESLSYVEYFIQQQVKFYDYEMYEDFCKLLQNATQILKKDSKSLVQNCFHFFYNTIRNLKLPETNISEVDKNTISIFATFSKLLANVTLDIVEVLFENGGLTNVNLEDLIKFIIYISYHTIDPSIRRTLIKSLKSIVNYIIKILANNNSPSETLLGYVMLILSGSFQVYARLNVSDPIDFNTLPEIVQLHYYVLKGLPSNYYNYISNFLDQGNSQQFIGVFNNYDVKKFKVGDDLLNFFNYIASNNFQQR